MVALKCAAVDSVICLILAFFINAAILILSATAFYYSGNAPDDGGTISSAYALLSPALGQKAASILFAVALLCAGQ